MRQICLVAKDLDAVEADLRAVFGIEVCHRDPGVGRFGLHNFLMPIGNNFLEVVAPTQEGTAGGRYLERRGGDGGYMVIMQCDDAEAAKTRVTGLDIRLVMDTKQNAGLGINHGIQLHPKDLAGAIAELRQNEGAEDPAGPWSPAGDDWQKAKKTNVTTAMTAAEIQSDEPALLAQRWSAVIDRPVERRDGIATLALDDATIRFVPAADGRGEGLGGLDLVVVDKKKVKGAAEARGCAVDGDVVMVCGVRFRLV
jgi:hypothetical protein